MPKSKKKNTTVRITKEGLAVKNIHQALAIIQRNLKAPKGQFNKFANFKYRSCEDILEAIKPLLGNFHLTISDEVVMIGERYYVKATVKLSSGKESIENTAYARESLAKKGMDESQITGAASSYARKYALNGLFAIDDTKDADSKELSPSPEVKADRLLTEEDMKNIASFLQEINNAKTISELNKIGIRIKAAEKVGKYNKNQIIILRQAYASKSKKLASK